MPGSRRTSQAVRKNDVKSMAQARSYARSIDRPLDHIFTIHWGCAEGPGPGGYRKRMNQLFCNVRDWMRRCQVPFMHIWILEGSTKEAHMHGMLHVPHRFLPKLEAYLRQQLGGPEEVLDIRKANPKIGGETGWFRYIIKGCEADVRRALSPPNRGPQGTIVGKRCGFSSNLGPAARGRAEESV